MDEKVSFDRVQQFIKNFSKKHQGISNLYVFTSVDRDGNVVDEKYGMNLMTRQGFNEIYADGVEFSARDTSNNTVKLYVGTGENVSQYTILDTDLEIPAFGGAPAINYDTTKAFDYPMYFSKGENDGEGFITLISRFLIAYYDFNIDNYPGQYALTEYGIKHNNTLWTHSRIYDIKGERATMLKDDNTQLWITVYMCLSFYESIIINGWSHNRFTVITQNNIMYDRMGWSTRVKVYKRGERVIDLTPGNPSRTQSTIETSIFRNSVVAPEAILYDNNSDTYQTNTKVLGCGYIDGFTLSEEGFIIVEPQSLATSEDITCVNMQSSDPLIYAGFANKFGMSPERAADYSKDQYPQITHLTNAHAYLYDVKSGDWTCELDILNPNKYYDAAAMGNVCSVPITYINNNHKMTAYIYQNLKTDDRILEVTSGADQLYATNKYWSTGEDNNQDPDKGWVWIRNYSDIPQACQTARYWITNTNNDILHFKRASDNFQLLMKGTQNNGYGDYIEYTRESYIAPICDNYTYKWYKRGDKVYIPDKTGRPITTVGTQNDENMTYGKYLITFPDAVNKINVADMTNAVSGTVTPQQMTLPFTGDVNVLNSAYRTESGTGLICLESLVSGIAECVVIDLRGGSLNISLKSWKHACCIWGTTKIAYISSDSTDTNIHILNYSNNQEESPIPIPSGVSDIPHMFGHTDYLWLTNGSSFGYICNLSTTRTPTAFPLYSGLYGTGLQTVKYACVDEVFIMYKSDECHSGDIKKAHYFKLSEPDQPQALTDFPDVSSQYIGGMIIFDLRYINSYNRAANTPSKALVLTISRGWSNSGYSEYYGSENYVIDFGQYIHNGVLMYHELSSSSQLGNLCLYGEYMIYNYTRRVPLINLMPIKLTGKSDTISAMNNIKDIKNKSWLIDYTHTPSWGDGGTVSNNGKPPGVPLTITDGGGNIIGWSWD